MTFPQSNILNLGSGARSDAFAWWTIDSASGFTYEMTVAGTSGEVLIVDWGDSTSDEITFTGSDQILTHVYGVGTFNQKWLFEKTTLTKVQAINGQNIINLPEITDLTALDNFRVTGNSTMTYDLSNWDDIIKTWTSLSTLRIENNDLFGDISGWSSTLASLPMGNFRLSSNNLSGDLSSWSSFSSWNPFYLYLDNNNFTGDISGWSVFSSWSSTTSIDIRINNLTGDLSSWSSFSSWTSIKTFFVSDNNLSGDISGWSAFNVWSACLNFEIQNNNFSGDISGFDTTSWSSINVYKLSNNANLTGYCTNIGLSSNSSRFWISDTGINGANKHISDFLFPYRAVITKVMIYWVQNSGEILTGIYQEPDLGAYTGSIHDLSEASINSFSRGDLSNVAWSTLEKIWVIENLQVSSTDTNLRYSILTDYSSAISSVKVFNSGALGAEKIIDPVTNGGASGADDFINATGGLAENWFVQNNALTTTIETGFGGVGNSQKAAYLSGQGYLHSALMPCEIGKKYRFRFKYKADGGTSDTVVAYRDSSSTTGAFGLGPNIDNGQTDWIEYRSNIFTATDTQHALAFSIFNTGQAVQIDEVELVEVISVEDWENPTSGLAEGWSPDPFQSLQVYSIVTGNGFTGNAQKIDNSADNSTRGFKSDLFAVTNGSTYALSYKFRGGGGQIQVRVLNENNALRRNTVPGTNTGGAKIVQSASFTANTDNLYIIAELVTSGGSQDWLEIDEIEILEI